MKDESIYTHVLYHDDLSGLAVGPLTPGFDIIARGMGKYIECCPQPRTTEPGIHVFGDCAWRDQRLRAVVTPVSFATSQSSSSFCGIVARYKNPRDFIALVLDRDDCLKLLRRTVSGFELLARAPLEFCIGQSLSLTLAARGNELVGTAGPYAGATTIRATLDETGCGKAGFIATCACRFGPHTVECEPGEAARVANTVSDAQSALKKKKSAFPRMKLDRAVPLHGLVTDENLEFADLNGDGKLEILAGQCSDAIAERISLRELTCLTALGLDGGILWQAGVFDENGNDHSLPGKLPFRCHDLFGDGHPVVVCVFGFDIQVRDAKTGKVVMSAQTPSTVPVTEEFKAVVGAESRFGYGDETLNMDVLRIGFCDTQGTGAKKEIIVADDFNLAILDPLAEPTLNIIFRHRGDLRGHLWVGDVDGDGKDEIFAGSSLINDDGSLISTVRCAAQATSTHIFGTPQEGFKRRVCVCTGDEGIWVFDGDVRVFDATAAIRVFGSDLRTLSAGKFRSYLPGMQYAASGDKGVTFFDANFHKIGSYHFDICAGVVGEQVVNWTGKSERLLLLGWSKEHGGGLVDGYGDHVVPFPKANMHMYYKVVPGYCPDGRDAIAAWNSDELAIYVPAE